MNYLDVNSIEKYLKELYAQNTSESIIKNKLTSVKTLALFLRENGYLTEDEFNKIYPFIKNEIKKRDTHFKRIKNFLHFKFKNTHSKTKNKLESFSKKNSNTFRYINYAMLIVFISLLTAGLYDQFFKKVNLNYAYPASPTSPGSRIISFQGRLTDTLGNPITSNIAVDFNFYNAAGATTPLTTRSCNIQPDQDGIFNSLIGQDCGSALPDSLFTENQNVFLGVKVGSDPEMSPRQQIANVGYAINSETLQGLPAGTGPSSIPFIDASGQLLMAASTPSIRSSIASATFAISSANAVTIQAEGTGNLLLGAIGSGKINFQTGSAVNMTLNNDGNLGIGSTDASYKLDVQGGTGTVARFSGRVIGGTAISSNEFVTLAQLQASASSLWLDGGSYLYPNSTNATDVMIPSGNVGIGTSALTSGTKFAVIGGNVGIGTTNALGLLNVSVGATNALFVHNLGNVGIGTTNPLNPLHIYSTNSTQLRLERSGANSQAALEFKNGDGYVGTVALGGDERLYFSTPSTNYALNILDSGNVGIGTTNPLGKLSIQGTYADIHLKATGGGANLWSLFSNNNADGSFQISSGSTSTTTTKFTILSSGNVGIGSTNPSALLSVGAGNQFNINSTGNLTKVNNVAYSWPSSQGSAGTFLQNNGSGTLTWSNNIGGLSVPFNVISSGTNTSASMTVGSGAVLGYTGTGVINASLLNGLAGTSLPYVNNATNGTLTRSGSGPYTLGLNLGNANTWTAIQNMSVGATASTLTTTGTINGQTISSTASFTGTVGVTTSVSSPTFQGNSAAVTFGNASYATTIAGSALTVSPTSWTATPTISGLITATGGLTANGALTANAAFTLGDGGDLGSVNTSDWDISTTGAMTGISGITNDSNYSQTGGTFNFRNVLYSNGTNVGVGTTAPGGIFQVNIGATNAILVKTDGNVGIGTTTPTGKLSVGANNQFTVDSTGNLTKVNNVAYSWPSSQGSAGTFLQNNGSGTLTWSNNIGGLSVPFNVISSGTNTSASMTVGSGAVLGYTGTGVINASLLNGISGTSLPYVNNATNGTLTRSGSGPYTLGLNLGNANTWSAIQNLNAGATASTLTTTGIFVLGNNSSVGSVNTSDWDISTTGAMTGISGITNDSNYSQTGGTFNFRNVLYSNGTNVGVGTTAPGNKLDISGGSARVFTGNRGFILSASTNTSGLSFLNYGTSHTGIFSNGSDIWWGNASSNENNSDGWTKLGVFSSTGNVGIGSTNPSALLSVGAGNQFNINSTGNLTKINNVAYSWPSSQGGVGTILTNNGSGTLTWTSNLAGSSLPFSQIQSGTNTSASMTVGSGAVLGYTGTGVINASLLNGLAGTSLPYVNNATNGTLTRSGSGPYTLGLNLGNANTWSAIQNLNAGATASTLTTTGIFVLGNNSSVGSVNTSDWDISTTGAMTGISGITNDSNYSQTGGTFNFRNVLYSNGTNVGVGTTAPGSLVEILGGHTTTRLKLNAQTAQASPNDSAILSLWASEPGLSYTGVGIGNNINGSSYYGRVSTARGASYIRLLDNSIAFNTINTAGTDSTSLTISGNSWTATPTISGLITATSGLTANGALTANAAFTLGDGGDLGSINTSDWDISTTGAMTGISGITNDSNYSQTGGTFNFRNVLYSNGTNVGVGTVSPGAKMEVSGTGNGLPTIAGTTQPNASMRIGNSLTNGILDIGINGGNGAWFQYTNKTDLSASYPILFNPNGGNVGIASTNPSALLSVGANNQFTVDSTGNLTKVNNVAYSWPGSQGGTSTFLMNNGSGTLSWTNNLGGMSVPFSQIQSGTNTSASMTVGSGAVLGYTGTGVINASLLNGLAGTSLPYVNNATNGTLTRSGSGPYTLGLNLGNANTWTAIQNMSVGATASALAVTGIASVGSGVELGSGGNRSLSYLGPVGNGYFTHMQTTATSGYGTYGSVSGDWALYNRFSGATTRGWIWQLGTTNIASLSGTGALQTAASVSSPIFQGNSAAVTFGNASYATNIAGSTLNYKNLLYSNGTNVGVGTVTPGSKLEVYGGAVDISSASTHHYYNVVDYSLGLGSTVATAIITLPKYGSSTMLQIKINGYNYSSNVGAWEVLIGGYNYSAHSWISTSVEFKGTPPFNQVRLANNGTNDVILLGTTSTSWSYPKITVSEVITSHSNLTGWGTGWSIGMYPTEPTLYNVTTLTPKYFVDASGNFGIGNTAPSFNLDVTGTARVTTSVSSPTFQGNSAAVTFGNASYATTIAGSALTVSPTSWTATPTISGLITATSGLTANGALTANAAFTLGDNGDLGYINTSDWDISTTGALTGISGITNDSNYSQTDGTFNFRNVLYSNGTNVGVGTVSPGAKMDVSGTLRASSLTDYDNTSYGLDPAGNFDGSGNSLKISQGALLALSSGNVGIGGTASHKLQVYGNIGISSNGYLNFGAVDGSTGYGVRDNAGTIEVKSSGGSWAGLATASGTANYISKFTAGNSLGNSLVYDNGTYVGVGVTNPGAKLTILGGEGTYTSPNFGSANLGAINIRNITSDRRNGITFSSANSSNAQAGIYVNQDNSLGTHMYLATTDNYTTGPQARLTIRNNGNVGIGTTLPSATLEVNGTLSASYMYDLQNSSYGIDPAGVTNFGGYSLKITGGALLAQNSGNVGIGATTPSSKLDVRTSSSASQLHISGDGTDSGAYFTSGAANNAWWSGGSYWNGSNWIAKTTSSVIYGGDSYGFNIYYNSGLTSGASFTPSAKLTISSNGTTSLNGNYFTNYRKVEYVAGNYSVQYLDTSGSSTWLALDTSESTSSTSYTKMKEFILYSGAPSLKIQFTNDNSTTCARIYKSGVAVGTERCGAGTYTETINTWEPSSYVQLYIKNAGGTTNQGRASGFKVIGTILVNGITTTDADLAEDYLSSEKLEPGDIVSITNDTLTENKNKPTVGTTNTEYDTKLAGIISSQPYETMGKEFSENNYPVALSGRVPVKVTDINGPIKTGDLITSSSINGYGMKATKSGNIVAKALEDFDTTKAEKCEFNGSLKCGKIMAFVSLEYFDNQSLYANNNNLNLIANTNPLTNYEIRDNNNKLFEKVAAFSQILVAQIKAGIIDSQKIITQNFIATSATIDNLITKTLTVNEKIVSPVVETKKIITEEIEPKQNDLYINLKSETNPTGESLSRVIIKGFEGKTIASIDNLGNASFAGTLTAKNATIEGKMIAQEASISGKIIAQKVEAENINKMQEDINTNNNDLSELSGNVNEIQKLLADIKNGTASTETTSDLTSTVESSNINIGASNTFNNITVSETALLYDAQIANSLTVGNLFMKNNEILSLTWELKLNSLSTVNILDGAIVMAKDGTITTKGSVIAYGGIKTNSISPISDVSDVSINLNGKNQNTNNKLAIKNNENNTVASIDASGSAKFDSIALNKYLEATSSAAIIAKDTNFALNGIYSPAIKTNSESAGTAILPKNENEIVIYTDKTKTNSLIYVTATSPTQNKTLFISTKESCETETGSTTCQPYFKVAIDGTISQDIKFNWWIVN